MIPFIKFNNGDLNFDIQKIESFDAPITVAKSFDANLDYPFALDIEDLSYWYAEQKERDEDFEKLKSIGRDSKVLRKGLTEDEIYELW